MKKDLSEHIAEVMEIEKRCGHDTLSCGPEDIADRYIAVLNMFKSILEDTNQGLRQLHEMLRSGRTSPEAVALILDYQNLAASPAKERIEQYFKTADYTSALVFEGALKESRSIRRDASREHIRRVVRTQQSMRRTEQHLFKGKGVVYTVITGEYDQVWEPLVVNPEWDYYCLCDSDTFTASVWKRIPYGEIYDPDPVRRQRKAKLLPWEFMRDYDYSIYVDGNIQIIGDLTEYIRWYAGDKSMLCFPHPSSNGLLYELSLIRMHRGKYYEAAKQQAELYLAEGYPDNFPMVSSAVLIRYHHDPKIKITMSSWWEEIQAKSIRDQISFGYACWKNDFSYDLCELDIYENPYVEVKSHQGS